MNVTVAESLVMKLLWARSPRRSEELIAELGPSENWSETTVRTLLARLVKKGAVAAEPDGRRFLYRPLISEADYLHAESKGLIQRLFDGRLGPFVTQFSEREKLTAEDVAHLKRLISDYEDGE
ncbi:BlaI/MecI/CopY family transcriptional regulator [Phenylobacterium sp.]|uniref:BlaI/MecI/CopY family transcriptional regulator n=1 Tax=Phenylobacterium sp. TaxID=1871053 RepID=UPI002F401B63